MPNFFLSIRVNIFSSYSYSSFPVRQGSVNHEVVICSSLLDDLLGADDMIHFKNSSGMYPEERNRAHTICIIPWNM